MLEETRKNGQKQCWRRYQNLREKKISEVAKFCGWAEVDGQSRADYEGLVWQMNRIFHETQMSGKKLIWIFCWMEFYYVYLWLFDDRTSYHSNFFLVWSFLETRLWVDEIFVRLTFTGSCRSNDSGCIDSWFQILGFVTLEKYLKKTNEYVNMSQKITNQSYYITHLSLAENTMLFCEMCSR